jgi:hypothetical protein
LGVADHLTLGFVGSRPAQNLGLCLSHAPQKQQKAADQKGPKLFGNLVKREGAIQGHEQNGLGRDQKIGLGRIKNCRFICNATHGITTLYT